MTSYTVIHDTNLSDLTNAVNDLLKQGYVLAGGLAVMGDAFYQALYFPDIPLPRLTEVTGVLEIVGPKTEKPRRLNNGNG